MAMCLSFNMMNQQLEAVLQFYCLLLLRRQPFHLQLLLQMKLRSNRR